MNRKQFLWLMLAVVVLGGIGLGMFWRDLTAYKDSGAKIGAPLLTNIKVSDVAKLRIKDSQNEVTLILKDQVWRVEQRGGYPADFAEISGLILKLLDVKVTQSEMVGVSLHPRLNLVAPGGDAKEGLGNLVELSDPNGKPLVSMVLGKVAMKKDPMNPLPNAKDGVPAGRHILVAGQGEKVVVVTDPLEKAIPRPGAWVAKDFFKADRIKTIQVAGVGDVAWAITRDEEWGQWKFASGGGRLHPNAGAAVNKAFEGLAFSDVIVDDKAVSGKPLLLTVDTFDQLNYKIKLTPQDSGDYALQYQVSGTPSKTRKPEPNEKAEDSAKRDKEYAEMLQRLEARVMLEQARSQWAYLVPSNSLSTFLMPRSQMLIPANARP